MAKKAATLVFTGSCVEGLRAADGSVVDLGRWAGLDLDDEQADLICDAMSDIAIVKGCRSAIIFEEEHDADMPGQSDRFIEVRSRDVAAFRREVAQIMKKIIEGD